MNENHTDNIYKKGHVINAKPCGEGFAEIENLKMTNFDWCVGGMKESFWAW